MKSRTEENVEKIGNLDVGVFEIPSETSVSDKISLLRLQNLVRCKKDGYVYLEVGSHLGGTLVPHLIDPQCKKKEQYFHATKRELWALIAANALNPRVPEH